jgi:mannose-6-phosphate isomerase-like protein (cupin superfamily)
MACFDIQNTYVHLTDGPAVRPVEVGPDFWQTLDQNEDLAGGRLAMIFHFEEDWSTWERHPAGDELVCLLSGAVDLVLEEGSGERVVELRGRSATIVPRGVWHTARVLEPSDGLFVTRGEGTATRPV